MDNEELGWRLRSLNEGIEKNMKAIKSLSCELEKMVKERSAILDYFEDEVKRKSQEESK